MSETQPTSVASTAAAEAVIAAGRVRIREEAAALAAVADGLDESFIAAVNLIRSSPGKVIVVGVGTSGPVARRMAHLLSTSGTASLYLHPGDALHGGLGAISVGDVVLAISKGGRSSEINDFTALAQRRGAHVMVLTAHADSPLGQTADVTVGIPQTERSDPGGVIAMGSSLAAAVWGDALAIVLMQISGYSWDRVLNAHPSGAVGERQQLPEDLERLEAPTDVRGQA
jgi:D-arabinose 5-phosphate isomerase GutQ